MITLRIEYADVIIQDFEPGRGKLIISEDNFGYNFSMYWGSMGNGTTLSEFLCQIDSGYFVGKLGVQKHEIDVKKTMACVRSFIRKESGWKWYMDTEFDKELRDTLKSIQNEVCSQHEFVDRMNGIEDDLRYYADHSEAKSLLSQLSNEPWGFIELEEPRENKWLLQFHSKLKKVLSESKAA